MLQNVNAKCKSALLGRFFQIKSCINFAFIHSCYHIIYIRLCISFGNGEPGKARESANPCQIKFRHIKFFVKKKVLYKLYIKKNKKKLRESCQKNFCFPKKNSAKRKQNKFLQWKFSKKNRNPSKTLAQNLSGNPPVYIYLYNVCLEQF